MSDPDAIELATRRLAHALDALEAAAERRREADRGAQALAHNVQALGSDRARLANELDAATARSRALEAANREAAERVDGAVETIRGVLEAED
jgi:predicted  nucleic acid-binding Zn-ribbon protein